MTVKHVSRVSLWAGGCLLLPVTLVARSGGNMFTLYQMQTQDLPILIVLVLLLPISAFWAPQWVLPRTAPPARWLFSAGVLLVLALGWGSYAVMGDFPLSRDEHMVVFDMAVFAKWRLAAPLAPEWRPYGEALVPAFLLNADHPVGLVSDYLPVNALLRLAFSKMANPAFFNPVLALIGGMALYDIARGQFRNDPRALWVVMIVYVLSTQMLVATMTTYAMTAHMALNLIWLSAFLRGRRGGFAIAISTAFFAVGLHQVVFHLLFVCPFLLWRLRQGDWRTVLFYAAAYLLIVGWWVSYPHLALVETGRSTLAGKGTADFFTGKLLPLLINRDPDTIALMLLNLMRFFAWQNLAFLPLLISALPLAWRDRGLAAPLLWTVILTIFVIGFVLPFQGHGWGYRYLHPSLGAIALIAGFGYQRLFAKLGEKADGIVLGLSAATLAFAMPLLLVRAHDFVAMHVALERKLSRQTMDFLVLDTESLPSTDNRWAANAVDHVRNLPDLGNRPLRFAGDVLTEPMIIELCHRGTVGIVSRTDMHAVGFSLNTPKDSPRFDALVRPIKSKACLRPLG